MPEKKFKSILLVKLPYCSHPGSSASDEDFRTKLTFRPVPSLALATLCAFLDAYKTFDYNLKAIDLNIEAYAEPEVPIDIASYPELLFNCIRNNQYDVLALSAMFVFNVHWVDAAVELSRKYHPEARIIIGGGYPTLFPDRSLEKHDIDDCVIGEGEATFLHILNKYNNHQDKEFEKKFPFEGYATKNETGKVVVFPKKCSYLDLGDLPAPAWNYLNVEKYFKNSGDKVLPVECSRGCPYRCTFCCTYLSWGRRVRYKPVDDMINEIVGVNSKYNDINLYFIDDNISFSKEWVMQFLTNIVDTGLRLNVIVSNFSAKHLDEEIIDLLVKVGIKDFTMGVESGSQEIQRQIKKHVNFDKVREIVGIVKSKKSNARLLWMLGFPNETIEQMNMTFDLARELRANSNQFLAVLPYPGTELFDEAKSQNLLVFDENNLDKFDYRKSDYLKSEEWNYDKLHEMIYDANIEMNFLNNPSLETMEGREYILEGFKNLTKSLPEHIIAHIVIGYIYNQKNNAGECESHYNTAIELLENEKLHDTFFKYLSWDNPVIKDFNQYLEMKGINI